MLKTIDHIIQKYLYNSAGLIESQRLTLGWFSKRGLKLEFQKYENILTSKELLFEEILKLGYTVPDNVSTHRHKECLECSAGTEFKGLKFGYRKYCSRRCAAKGTLNLDKMKQTMLLKYGVENAFQMQSSRLACQTDEVKSKRSAAVQKTCLARYNKTSALGVKKFIEKGKETKLLKYGNEHYTNIEKQKETYLKMYGVEWNSQVPEIRAKQQKTLDRLSKIKDENGNTMAKRGRETRLADIDENGLNSYERVVVARLKDIDETGLNSYQIAQQKGRLKTRKTNEENGRWITEAQIKDFSDYSKLVRRYTRDCDLSSLSNIDKRGRTVGDWHLDHKYSIFQGFLDGISAEIVGNIVNLEMLSSSRNLSKNKKCSLTKEALLELYQNNS